MSAEKEQTWFFSFGGDFKMKNKKIIKYKNYGKMPIVLMKQHVF